MEYRNNNNWDSLQYSRSKNMAITKATLNARTDFEAGIKRDDYPEDCEFQFDMQRSYDNERQFLLAKAKNSAFAMGRV